MKNNIYIADCILDYNKGITPKYVEQSNILVLNQKCIRNNAIDFSLARYCSKEMRIKDSAFIKEGDILINSTGQGTAGRVAFVEKLPQGKRIVIDSHILKLECKNSHDPQCLSYFLFSIENLLQSYVDGSTGQGEFDRVRLENIIIDYSQDLQVQRNISSLLYTLDKKIKLNNQLNDNLPN